MTDVLLLGCCRVAAFLYDHLDGDPNSFWDRVHNFFARHYQARRPT